VARLARWLIARRGGGNDHAYPHEVQARLPLAHQTDPGAVLKLMREAGMNDVKARPLTEIERVERSHMGRLERLADTWIRYLASGRRPTS
jgi:hypothetical protein